MKQLIVFFYLFFSTYAFGSAVISLEFKKNKISQGELVQANLKLNQTGENKLQISRLNRTIFDGILYLHAVNVINGSYDNSFFQADTSVIFLQVPTKKPIQLKLNGIDVEVTWNDIEVEPTQAGDGFYFPTFSIPEKFKFPVMFFLLFMAGGLLFFVIVKLIQNLKLRKKSRDNVLKIKETLFLASNFDEIIDIWKRKHEFFLVFPHLENDFKKFETILFKHQFKPVVSLKDKTEVENAYRNFLESVKGGFSGV